MMRRDVACTARLLRWCVKANELRRWLTTDFVLGRCKRSTVEINLVREGARGQAVKRYWRIRVFQKRGPPPRSDVQRLPLLTWEMPPGVGVNLACVRSIRIILIRMSNVHSPVISLLSQVDQFPHSIQSIHPSKRTTVNHISFICPTVSFVFR